MESNDYTELQILIARLKKATIKATNTDEIFKRYHQSSLSILENDASASHYFRTGAINGKDYKRRSQSSNRKTKGSIGICHLAFFYH